MSILGAHYSKHPGNILFREALANLKQKYPKATIYNLVKMIGKDISPESFLVSREDRWHPMTKQQISERVARWISEREARWKRSDDRSSINNNEDCYRNFRL